MANNHVMLWSIYVWHHYVGESDLSGPVPIKVDVSDTPNYLIKCLGNFSVFYHLFCHWDTIFCSFIICPI